MTNDDSILETALTVFAVLLAIPILTMGVVMPLMELAGWGHMSAGAVGHMSAGPGGWAMVLMPAIPLVVIVGVGYVLYTGFSGGGRETGDGLEELRTAYARGELSDEEFENRRERLRRDQ